MKDTPHTLRPAFMLIGFLLLAAAGCGGGSHQQYLTEGLRLLEEGRYEAAARSFLHAAQRRPLSAAAYANLGIAYWRMGETDRAVEALVTASDLETGDANAMLMLSEVLQDAKRWSEARNVLEKLNAGLPDSPELMTHLARLEYRAGNTEEARALLEQVLKLDGTYAPALYDMAVLARDRLAEPVTAMRYFARYLSVATDEARLDAVGRELARLRQPQQATGTPAGPVPVGARDTAPAAAAAEPAAPTPTAAMLVAAARGAMDRKAADEALVLLGRARALDPNSADALWLTALLYEQELGQANKAEPMLRDFVARFPDDKRAEAARHRLAQATSTVTRTPPAPAPVTQVTSRPSPPVPARSPGLVTAPPSRPEVPLRSPPPPATSTRSRSHAHAAIEPGSPRMDARSNREALQTAWNQGLEAHRARRWAEAIRHYEAALDLDPSFAGAAYNIGSAYRDSGDDSRALPAFERAATLDPRMAKAHYMIAVVDREQGRRRDAIASAQRVLKIEPGHDKAHFLLGLLYRESMDYERARQHFARAIELAPDEASRRKARTWLASTQGTGAEP